MTINFMYIFFILVHLLYPSIYFEHYCAHLQKDNCISTTSGIVALETIEWSKLLNCAVYCAA